MSLRNKLCHSVKSAKCLSCIILLVCCCMVTMTKSNIYEILIFKNKINYRMYMLVVARNVFVITSNDIKNRKSLVYFLLWFSLWQCWKNIKSITHISTIIDLTLLNIKIRTLYTFYLLIAVPQRYKVCILMLIKAILT